MSRSGGAVPWPGPVARSGGAERACGSLRRVGRANPAAALRAASTLHIRSTIRCGPAPFWRRITRMSIADIHRRSRFVQTRWVPSVVAMLAFLFIGIIASPSVEGFTAVWKPSFDSPGQVYNYFYVVEKSSGDVARVSVTEATANVREMLRVANLYPGEVTLEPIRNNFAADANGGNRPSRRFGPSRPTFED